MRNCNYIVTAPTGAMRPAISLTHREKPASGCVFSLLRAWGNESFGYQDRLGVGR